MSSFPVLVRSVSLSGEARYVLGDPVVDRYLEFVGGRCRANTVRAVAHDLKTFFAVIDQAPLRSRRPTCSSSSLISVATDRDPDR